MDHLSSFRAAGLAGVAALVAVSAGCTSALTTTYLRSFPWDLGDHAAEAGLSADDGPASKASASVADEAVDGGLDGDPGGFSERDPVGGFDPPGTVDDDQRQRRSAAIDEAVKRLSKLAVLDPEAREALVATLRNTQPEDWPVVIDEFVKALPARAAQDTPIVPADSFNPAQDAMPQAIQEVSFEPPEESPSEAPEAPPRTPAGTAEDRDFSPTSDDASRNVLPSDADDSPSPSPPPGFAIRNPCFASKVRAWGSVDRFPAERLREGREVIVYFELENLSTKSSPGGHTTCVDTVLRLIGSEGDTLHEWTFEPLAETCATPRRDYFARYVIRLPKIPPTPCQVEVQVTDTLGGRTATATLPLPPGEADLDLRE